MDKENMTLESDVLTKDDVHEIHEQQPAKEAEAALNYWLLENMKIMEKLTVKEPVSWSEQDWGG